MNNTINGTASSENPNPAVAWITDVNKMITEMINKCSFVMQRSIQSATRQ
jgi:hypothetical protein